MEPLNERHYVTVVAELYDAAEERGHEVEALPEFRGWAGSVVVPVRCVNCEMGGEAREFTAPNEIEVSGEIVALNCPGS